MMGQRGFSQQTKRSVLTNFENLTVDSTTHRVYYEQRLYRNPLIGLIELNQALTSQTSTEYVPMYQGVPIAGYRLSSPFQATLLSRQERKAINRVVPFSMRRYKFDFRIQPEVIANFGFKLDPYQTKTSLLLQSQLYLTRGLVLNFGLEFRYSITTTIRK
ncbi:hypothetical protein HMF3257_11500 [Spirosoma telluris]|uniref:Uncharacterized protein n=1 Tax=Spirosoma telluris TaxID=2183553 RepID=A0A327NH72_9BACT|nr:hypothetical protein HMF3257_11500 [Spirosoma telluris]